MSSVWEFEKILDSAEKKVGNGEQLFSNVCAGNIALQGTKNEVELKTLIDLAKMYEAQKKAQLTNFSSISSPINKSNTSYSREQRRAMAKAQKGKSVNKRKKR